ncbi:hypothetical protein EIL50_02190 [bacterium NHP-B]|nr:hypothetical protein EIL50_02190 [bacterium NHP-B]
MQYLFMGNKTVGHEKKPQTYKFFGYKMKFLWSFLTAFLLLIVFVKFFLDVFPISLRTQVTHIKQHLPPGVYLRFRKPVLTWRLWRRPFEVVLHDVYAGKRAHKDAKDPTFHASSVGVCFAWWPLLKEGRLIPRSLFVDHLHYTSVQDKTTQDLTSFTFFKKALSKGAKKRDMSSVLSQLAHYHHPLSCHLQGDGYALDLRYQWFDGYVVLSGTGLATCHRFCQNTPLSFLSSMRAQVSVHFQKSHQKDDLRGHLFLKARSKQGEKVAATLSVSPQKIVMERAFLRTPLASCDMEGSLELRGDYPFAVSMKIPDISFQDVLHVWPEGLASATRLWLKEHTQDGRVEGLLSLQGSLEATDKAAFGGHLMFDRLKLTPLDGGPTLQELRGAAHFNTQTFDIVLSRGKLRQQKLREGKIYIKGLDTDAEHMAIHAVFEGDVQDALQVISRPPLDYAKTVRVPLDSLAGRTETKLSFAFPLIQQLKMSEVKYAVDAKLTDLSYTYDLPFVAGGATFTKGEGDVSVSPKGLSIKAKARYVGEHATLDFYEDFSGKQPSILTLGGRVTHDHKKLLGLKGLGVLPVPFAFKAIHTVGQDFPWHIEADFTQTELTLGHLTKPGGEAAFLNFDLGFDKDDTVLRNLQATIGDLLLTGTWVFDASWGLSSLVMKADKPGVYDWHLQLDKKEDVFEVSLKGLRFGGYWLTQLFLKDTSDDETLLHNKDIKCRLKARVGRASFTKDLSHPLNNLNVDFNGHLKDNMWHVTSFLMEAMSQPPSGQSPQSLRVERSQTPEGSISWYVGAGDAGYFLAGLNLLDDVRGGVLSSHLVAKDAQSPFEGEVLVSDFSVRRTPFLQRFFMTFLSPAGFVKMLAGEQLGFRKLFGELTLRGGVIETPRLVMRGDTTLVMNGWVDVSGGRVNVHGNLIPAYFLNRFLTNIPVLGPVIFGGQDDGLLATRFYVNGSFDNLKIQANPFQMITPGFLKRYLRENENKKMQKALPQGS